MKPAKVVLEDKDFSVLPVGRLFLDLAILAGYARRLTSPQAHFRQLKLFGEQREPDAYSGFTVRA